MPNENVGTVSNTGAVWLYFGSTSGITTTGSQLWSEDSIGVTSAAGDQFAAGL